MNYEYMALFALSVLASFLLTSGIRSDIRVLKGRVDLQWDHIKRKPLPGIQNGSRVMITRHYGIYYKVANLQGDLCDLYTGCTKNGEMEVYKGIPTCILELA